MERRVTNAFPGPPPPVPYYHNNNNYNHPPPPPPPHHQIHHPPPPHHHIAAVGFNQYAQNENRDQRFNQPHFDNHYPAQQQQQQHNMIVDAPPFPPSSGFSPSGGSLRKRRSLSSTPDPTADPGIAKLYVAPVPRTFNEDDSDCTGAGADTSQRVPWLKKLSLSDVAGFASVSFIDQDGWISRCPIKLEPSDPKRVDCIR